MIGNIAVASSVVLKQATCDKKTSFVLIRSVQFSINVLAETKQIGNGPTE
jgi:hypothetical protein